MNSYDSGVRGLKQALEIIQQVLQRAFYMLIASCYFAAQCEIWFGTKNAKDCAMERI